MRGRENIREKVTNIIRWLRSRRRLEYLVARAWYKGRAGAIRRGVGPPNASSHGHCGYRPTGKCGTCRICSPREPRHVATGCGVAKTCDYKDGIDRNHELPSCARRLLPCQWMWPRCTDCRHMNWLQCLLSDWQRWLRYCRRKISWSDAWRWSPVLSWGDVAGRSSPRCRRLCRAVCFIITTTRKRMQW